MPVFELIERVARTGDVAVLRAEIHGDQRAVCASLVLGRGAMDVALPCRSGLRAQVLRRWIDGLRPADFSNRGAVAPGGPDAD